MTDMAESSSIPSKIDKPVFLRVKRKASQSPLEALWLEINERPVKRPLLDFGNLSLSDSSAKAEESKVKKVFVQRVETVSTTDVPLDVLQSFAADSANSVKSSPSNGEKRRSVKPDSKQAQLLLKSKQKQVALAKNARFEQIWTSRRGRDATTQNEAYKFYDILRVDEESTVQKQEEEELENQRLMSSFLPLLREFIPIAAEEIETDINDFVSKPAYKMEYVYDLYAVTDNVDMSDDDVQNPFPLVQVDNDDGLYDGIDGSDYASDDSNDENNPRNEYPEEESTTDEEKEENVFAEDYYEEDEQALEPIAALQWKYRSNEDQAYYDDDEDDDYR